MLPVRTILHPTDLSEYSRYAFRMACSVARDYDARLVILHVAKPTRLLYQDGMLPPEPAVYLDHLRRQLQELQSSAPLVQTERRLVEGDPVTEIVEQATEGQCDLIVMGTHGRTGLQRMVLGSVAEQVARRAPCPVLTVKRPPAQPVTIEERVSEEADPVLGAAR